MKQGHFQMHFHAPVGHEFQENQKWSKNAFLLYGWTCTTVFLFALRKHAYSKYIENFTIKNWKFSDKNSNIFSTFLLKT